MAESAENQVPPGNGHIIICGFGLPGRAVATILEERGDAFCVIELNPQIVKRCGDAGLWIIHGDAAQKLTLELAGIDRARLLIIAIPNDKAAIDTTIMARQLNPTLRIITRCHYTSIGMAATRAGAEAVVVAEQVVAQELKALVWERLELPKPNPTPPS